MVDDYGSTKTPVNHEGANRREDQLAMFVRCRCFERRWKCSPFALLCVALSICSPTDVAAQAGTASAKDAPLQGSFPDASFDATFRKYTPPENVFSPFYSWDAQMALSLTTFRKGSGAVNIAGFFQSVGTENLGSRVSVGGTGYQLGFGYVHTHSDRFELSAGFRHFSSHLTRDLDDKLEEERNKGETIPEVDDPSEFNVVFVGGYWKLSAVRFAPEIEVVVQPINFKFNGSPPDEVRPVYLRTRWTLWRGDQKSIVAETQQEFGENPLNHFSLVLALFARNQPEGRFQVFISASPGGNLHVSPTVGAVRDGIAVGLRLHFRG
jgi:hypothetical protein